MWKRKYQPAWTAIKWANRRDQDQVPKLSTVYNSRTLVCRIRIYLNHNKQSTSWKMIWGEMYWESWAQRLDSQK